MTLIAVKAWFDISGAQLLGYLTAAGAIVGGIFVLVGLIRQKYFGERKAWMIDKINADAAAEIARIEAKRLIDEALAKSKADDKALAQSIQPLIAANKIDPTTPGVPPEVESKINAIAGVPPTEPTPMQVFTTPPMTTGDST